jgi:two-component system, sensor histidine kinase and response regulator
MDGYLSAKEIRELRRDIYIVAQTAYVFNEREKTTVAGFNDFLAKPFNVEQLFAVINRFLERQHQ